MMLFRWSSRAPASAGCAIRRLTIVGAAKKQAFGQRAKSATISTGSKPPESGTVARDKRDAISCSETGRRKRACEPRDSRRKRGGVVSHGRSDGHGGQRGKAPRAVDEQRRQVVRRRCRCGQGH